MISDEQYKKAKEQIEEAKLVISEYHHQRRQAFKHRMETNPVFSADELTFAAYERCDCGAGYAYPNDCGPDHYWQCSAILMGKGEDTGPHSPSLRFALYEVKSENQPSANGATTRLK